MSLFCRQPQWSLRLTHVPTGETVVVDSDNHRNQFHARNKGLSLLRSRILYKPKSLPVIASYELPDDVQYPHDLSSYRKDLT